MIEAEEGTVGLELNLEGLFSQDLAESSLEAMTSVDEVVEVHLPQPIYRPDVRRPGSPGLPDE